MSPTAAERRRTRRRWVGGVLAFLGIMVVALAITASLMPLPAPAAGGTCGPGKGSESALAAFVNPGSIGATGPSSSTVDKLDLMAFTSECQSATDARMLQALGLLLLGLILLAGGLLVLRPALDRTRPSSADGPADQGAPAGWYEGPEGRVPLPALVGWPAVGPCPGRRGAGRRRHPGRLVHHTGPGRRVVHRRRQLRGLTHRRRPPRG